MPTDIELCANALILLGETPITSFSDSGNGATAASNLYERAYENLLSMHRWRFAVGKAQLARLTATPLNEWTYAFQLPTDFLAMVRVYPDTNFEIFDGKLYSDNTEVEIDYVFKPEETALPAYFTEMMEFYLASKFAIPVTGNRSLSETYYQQYRDQLARAMFIDSQGRPNDAIVDSPFIEART